MNSPTLTGHPVTSLWQMANTSPWMSWDVMRAGKGLSKIFETLHSDSPSQLSPVQTSFCDLDLFSRSWGRLKETSGRVWKILYTRTSLLRPPVINKK